MQLFLKKFFLHFFCLLLLFWSSITTWYIVDLYRRRSPKSNAKDVENEKPIQLSIQDKSSRCNFSFLKPFVLLMTICDTYVTLLYSPKVYNNNHIYQALAPGKHMLHLIMFSCSKNKKLCSYYQPYLFFFFPNSQSTNVTLL